MANTSTILWCLIEGHRKYFEVTATDVSINVNALKKIIKKEAELHHPAHELTLWKVRCFWGFVLTLWVTPLYP